MATNHKNASSQRNCSEVDVPASDESAQSEAESEEDAEPPGELDILQAKMKQMIADLSAVNDEIESPNGLTR